jgi:uncharacterized protein (DUF1015 family)
MARIAPFRSLRYDLARVPLAQAATQPYDKITPEMQDGYYAASPYNLVRIILGKKQSDDHAAENIYSRAAGYFSRWRRDGVFLQDAEPSIYRYAQSFTAPGTSTQIMRDGFIALGRVEDYAAGVVHRHEQTLSKPKADRLDLLRATRAHFGQIFMLYSDPKGEIETALAAETEPDASMRDEYGVEHSVWKISESALVKLVCGKMNEKKLIIADGHHRYETALNYRNERRSAAGMQSESSGSSDGGAELPPYEFAMMTFVNMDSPGLLILPTHRVVHGLPDFSVEAFQRDASKYFNVRTLGAMNANRATAMLRDAGKSGTALLAVMKDTVLLLERTTERPEPPDSHGNGIFSGLSLRQQSLDVVQLHKCLLEGVLRLSEESIRNQQNIGYLRDAEEAIAQVRNGAANIAFLMNPARMEQIRDIAFAGEVLPQKSTDFYPKLLSGLTVYALE